jgi:hypothetical protein
MGEKEGRALLEENVSQILKVSALTLTYIYHGTVTVYIGLVYRSCILWFTLYITYTYPTVTVYIGLLVP